MLSFSKRYLIWVKIKVINEYLPVFSVAESLVPLELPVLVCFQLTTRFSSKAGTGI
jgi:hypothetical protein